MSSKSTRITTAIVLLMVFATGHVYVGASLGEPGAVVPVESVATESQPTGVLATSGNKEISVNSFYSLSGATIISGAIIETPAGVRAMVTLSSRGSLEIEPNTKLTLEFDHSSVKAILSEGCLNLLTKKGTTGELTTPKGSIGKTDPAQDGKLEICPPRGAARTGGSDGLFGLGSAAVLAIIARGETTVAVPVAPRGILY